MNRSMILLSLLLHSRVKNTLSIDKIPLQSQVKQSRHIYDRKEEPLPTLSMNRIKDFIWVKLSRWKQKSFLKKKKEVAYGKNMICDSLSTDSFRFCGFFQVEPDPPSSNRFVIAYELDCIRKQTATMMLRAFQMTLTPKTLSCDPNDLKITWIELMWRGLLPLYDHDHDGFHVPKRLRQTLNSKRFHVTVDKDFKGTIDGCASTTGENQRVFTWLSPEIARLMIELNHLGYAHSVEVWQDEQLVGGLYGVSLGAYFTIESQFSFVKDASKIALVHLVARLRLGGYEMLDIDEITSHLDQFGAYELSRDIFRTRMKVSAAKKAIWLDNNLSFDQIRQEIKQLH